jgi:hypothetical protein
MTRLLAIQRRAVCVGLIDDGDGWAVLDTSIGNDTTRQIPGHAWPRQHQHDERLPARPPRHLQWPAARSWSVSFRLASEDSSNYLKIDVMEIRSPDRSWLWRWGPLSRPASGQHFVKRS